MPTSRTLLLTLAFSLAAASAALGEGNQAGGESFTFSRLDREYRNSAAEMAPVEQGPLTLRLSSPGSSVTLIRHTLTLWPLADGSHRAEVDFEIAGGGALVADITVAGTTSRLEDEVVIPAQRHRLEGRVEIVPEGDGYVFTARELPETLELAIESRLAGRVVGLCRAMALLPVIPLDCGALERRLSTAVVPLPPPGGTFLLAGGLPTPEERAALERYLSKSE